MLGVYDNLQRGIDVWIARMKSDLAQGLKLLKSYDPKAVLHRGYSITSDKDGKVIKSSKDLAMGSLIHTLLSEGSFDASVNKLLNRP